MSDEGHGPSEKLIGDDAEREDIGAAIDRIAARLLGRHVTRIAKRHPERGLPRHDLGLHELGETEVEELHEVALTPSHREEDVAWAKVAVDVPEVMRLMHGVGDLRQDLERALGFQLMLTRQ